MIGEVNVEHALRPLLLAACGATVAVAALSGCSGRAESFQTACDHLATAEQAAEDGDSAAAKKELESAYSWVVPAYEDTEGAGERKALDDLSIALNLALSNFNTEQGRHALADANKACS